jgi:hypothetical protein
MTESMILNLLIVSMVITCLLGVFIIVECFINILDWFKRQLKWRKITNSNIYFKKS